MPNPVTQVQTVGAVNTALQQLQPPGNPIVNLDTNAMSNLSWSCNNFSPSVLDAICLLTNTNPEDLNTQNYGQGANLPAAFADGTFVNISMTGEPSKLNHNFNILVSGGTTYLIQVYIEHSVNIVRLFANVDFITHWHNLSNNINWVNSYFALFGVAPNQVVANPPINTWLKGQNVTQ
jgi:hypothetical protein